MSARDELFRRVAGAFIDEDKANALLDAYRAEVLVGAAEWFESACPDKGGDEAFALCHCDAAFLLRSRAVTVEAGDER